MERDTKTAIKSAALRLFSVRGYSAVSIRDICREVGIKESTVYYHFENKKAIFSALLGDFEEMTATVGSRFGEQLDRISRLEEEAFVQVGLAFLRLYLLDERILPFLRMLMIEQHVDGEAAGLYQKVLFEAPMKHNVQVFRRLLELRCFTHGDPEGMALEYYAPVFFVFHRYFASGAVTEEALREAETQLRVHFRSFYRRYAAQPGAPTKSAE